MWPAGKKQRREHTRAIAAKLRGIRRSDDTKTLMRLSHEASPRKSLKTRREPK